MVPGWRSVTEDPPLYISRVTLLQIWPCVPRDEVPRNACRNYEIVGDYWSSSNSLASASLAELLRVNTSKTGDVVSSGWRCVE